MTENTGAACACPKAIPPHEHIYFPVEGKEELNDYIFFSKPALLQALRFLKAQGMLVDEQIGEAHTLPLAGDFATQDRKSLYEMYSIEGNHADRMAAAEKSGYSPPP